MNDTWVKPTPSPQIATTSECIHSMNQYDEIENILLFILPQARKGMQVRNIRMVRAAIRANISLTDLP